jgi:hypothetical protein
MILRRTARDAERRGAREVRGDETSKRRLRSDVEVRGLTLGSESREQPWLSHSEGLEAKCTAK